MSEAVAAAATNHPTVQPVPPTRASARLSDSLLLPLLLLLQWLTLTLACQSFRVDEVRV